MEQRRHAEVQAREARAHLNRVFERVTDAFVALDSNWCYTYVNARAGEMFGRRPEELIGKHIWTVFPEGIGHPFQHAYERAMEEQQRVRFEDYFPPWDRWFENIVYPAPDGMSIYFHDITEKKKAGLALQEAEARLRLATEGSNTALWDWDLRTNEVYFSPIWKRQIGYEDHEIPNRFEEWESRVHPDDLPGSVARTQAFLERPQHIFANEFRFRHRNGSYRWILAQSSVIADETGKPVRLLGSHIDITERKEGERRLEESRQQLRALLARMHRTREDERIRISREIHDELGQLLTGVKMDLSWVERKLEAAAASGDLGPVTDHVVSASELTDSTIAAVQRIAAELRPSALDRLGLDAALTEELRRFEWRSSVRATLHVSESFPQLPQEIADEVFYICREALTNVARHADAANVEIRLGGNRVAATVEVADDGAGIDDNKVTAALSLGLLGMRERALQARFEIRIERRQPSGTTIRMIIPRELL